MGQEESYTNNTNNSNLNLMSSNKQYLNFKINRSLFDFLYVIGRGGFGKVWKVRYKKTHKKYALKEMSKVKIIDRKSEKSIKNEKEFLSILHHPFLVNMMCSFQDYDNLYLVMDLLTGGDLRYHICHKKIFNEEQTKFFVSCVLTGLEYIHKNNIIHRDIKPENLVLDEKGYVAITDFGVAKKNTRDNSSETSGTPGYMAPEVLCAQNHSFPVDFFAVGVIAFEFLHGFRPYLGRNRKEIKEAVLAKQVHIHRKDCINNGWSLEAGDFINKMIYRKPMKRLGYNGIDEIKSHPWFKEVNWEDLVKKKIRSSFVPKLGDNFDKKYCEGIEKIGTQTEERYQYYMSKEKFKDLFKNYTFIRNDIQEVSNILYNNNNKIRDNNTNSNRNTTTSSKGSINNFNNNIKFNKNNNNINKNNINIMYQKLINNNFNLNNNSQINNNSAIFNNINNNSSNNNSNNNNSNNSNNFSALSLSKYLNRDNSTPNYYKHINNNSVNLFNFNNENQLNNNNNNNLSSTKYSTINLENNKNNKNKNLNISNKEGKLIYSPPHNIHQNSLNFSNNISNKTKEYIISIKNNNNNENNDYIINNNNNFVLQSPISSYSRSINKLGLSSSNSSANILGNSNIPKYYKIQHNSSNNNNSINNINNNRGIYQYYNNNSSNNNNFNNYGSSSNILKNNFLYDNSNLNNNKITNNIDFKTQRYKRVSSSSRGDRRPGLNKNSSMKFLNFNSSYYNNLNINNSSSSNINNNSNMNINNNINNYQNQNIKINSYNYNNKNNNLNNNNNNNMNPFSNISRIGNTGHYNFDINGHKYINPTNSSPKTQRPITTFKKSSSSVSMNIQNIY